MFLINEFTMSEFLSVILCGVVTYIICLLINVSVVTSKSLSKKYKLYERVGLEGMYWNNFVDKTNRYKFLITGFYILIGLVCTFTILSFVTN